MILMNYYDPSWLRRTLAVAIGLLCSNFVGAQKLSDCAPLDSAVKSRVVHFVARKLGTDPLLPALDEEKLVPGTCYRQLVFSVQDSKRHWTVYLSPDLRFLSAGLWDISVDVTTTDNRVAAQLLQEATTDKPPALGSSSAPVTLVEFSDFQCPYCARLSKMIELYRKENPDKVRVIFRHFPLPIHGWATPAARAGSCIAKQSEAAFWQFHDLLFSQQKTITAESLSTMIENFLREAPQLKKVEFHQCVGALSPENVVDRDLAEARNYHVVSTPTVFINGRQYGMFRNDAAFAAAIDAATPPAASKALEPSPHQE